MNDLPQPAESSTRAARLLAAVQGLQVLRHYRRQDLGPDLLAGLVICLVLIPSTLAYAELAGSGPMGGIYSAVVATIAYFLFASSRHMNVGPDGAVALLAGVAILPMTGGDPAKALVAGALLALFTGAILITAAKLRLGVVASFLSTPVLLGYLNGAAVVIIVSQWGKLFGIDLTEDEFFLRVGEWLGKVPETHLQTLAVGCAVLVLLMVTKRLIPRFPPLVPVFFIALLAGLFIDFGAMGVGVIGEIGGRGPQLSGLSLELGDLATLAVGALGLSMLIFPEGVLLGRAMAEKHNYDVDADRELVALGASNIATGLFSGFTVGGSQTRTLLNSATGGRTQVANLASAGFLVVYRFYAPLVFANVGHFIDRIKWFIAEEDHPVRQLVIDARAMPMVDYTAMEKVQPFLRKLQAEGIEVAIARAHLPLRELEPLAVREQVIPQERIFVRVSDAVAAFEARFPAEDPA